MRTERICFHEAACWLTSDGAKVDGLSDRLRRYRAAAEASFERRGPDWFDDFLTTRDWCSACGETYRLENLSFCTHCQALFVAAARPRTEILNAQYASREK